MKKIILLTIASIITMPSYSMLTISRVGKKVGESTALKIKAQSRNIIHIKPRVTLDQYGQRIPYSPEQQFVDRLAFDTDPEAERRYSDCIRAERQRLEDEIKQKVDSFIDQQEEEILKEAKTLDALPGGARDVCLEDIKEKAAKFNTINIAPTNATSKK